MAEMVASGTEAILIKVACMGLDPHKHLGRTLAQMRPHLEKLNRDFGAHVCGEGGEFESFAIDSPLFCRRVVIEESSIVMHSDDPFAPVGYLRVENACVEDKKGYPKNETHAQLGARCRLALASHDSDFGSIPQPILPFSKGGGESQVRYFSCYLSSIPSFLYSSVGACVCGGL